MFHIFVTLAVEKCEIAAHSCSHSEDRVTTKKSREVLDGEASGNDYVNTLSSDIAV